MDILKYDKFLEEVNLNLQELDKINKDGQVRGNIFVNKLMSGKDILTDQNLDVKISKMKDNNSEWIDTIDAITNITSNGKYDSDKAKDYLTRNRRYQKVFMGDNGQEYSLNQFKKTSDFGSIGSGRLIRQFESIQCIFLAIKQFSPNVILNPLNIEDSYQKFKNLSKFFKNKTVFLPDGIKINNELVDKFFDDNDWVATFCRVPNKLWNIQNNFVNRNFNYQFFHIGYIGYRSPFIHIYKKYREFSTNEGFSDINVSKYCPADVYMLSSEHNELVNESINKTKNIKELTNVIDDFFTKKILIPISLKKISFNSILHPFTIIENKEEGKELPEFRIQLFKIGSDMRGIGSKISIKSYWKHRNNKNVDIKDREFNFDSSDTSKNRDVDGEIVGSVSRHGKISFKSINRIIDEVRQKYLIQNIETHQELGKLNVIELEKKVIDLIDIIKSKNTNIVARQINGVNISNNENKLISRIQSLQIILAIKEIYDIDKELANSIVTKMMRYALSIQSDKFETPKYLKVI